MPRLSWLVKCTKILLTSACIPRGYRVKLKRQGYTARRTTDIEQTSVGIAHARPNYVVWTSVLLADEVLPLRSRGNLEAAKTQHGPGIRMDIREGTIQCRLLARKFKMHAQY